MKRASIKCLLNDIGAFVQKHLRKLTLSATISVALGLCYLFLKVTSLPSSKVVPYSELIVSLQNGSVSNVLIEEGSRRIYYNVNVQYGGNIEISDKESLAVSSSLVNVDVRVSSANEAGLGSSKLSNFNVFKKFLKAQVSTPEWQYCTRKIDHDEKFLLSLLRDKGTIYISGPQSVLMSMSSTLITILTLWIPLLPLMWLLYRQLSASNSPARKRRPNNEAVGFDDVEGVDAAKVELLEIVLCLQGTISYQKLGAKLPRGVLLVGPPGTGKTLLARAVAGEAGTIPNRVCR